MFSINKRNIFFVLGFATIIYFLLIVYTDSDQVSKTFKNFPIPIFLEALLFIIISIILKYFRWDFYLKKINISINIKSSFLIFLSGLLMSISPGKVGELLKAYLIEEKFNISKAKTFPIILAERVSEFISLLFIAVIGIVIYNFDSIDIVIPLLLICLVTIFFFFNQTMKEKIFYILSKSRFLKSRINKIELFHSSITELFKPDIFLKIQLISLLAWIAEFYSFFLILKSVSLNIDFYSSSYIYALSILIGAVSMLPGGIGTTEASLVYQLIEYGICEGSALTATFVIRIVTLWFSVLLGILSYLLILKNKSKKNDIFL